MVHFFPFVLGFCYYYFPRFSSGHIWAIVHGGMTILKMTIYDSKRFFISPRPKWEMPRFLKEKES